MEVWVVEGWFRERIWVGERMEDCSVEGWMVGRRIEVWMGGGRGEDVGGWRGGWKRGDLEKRCGWERGLRTAVWRERRGGGGVEVMMGEGRGEDVGGGLGRCT